MALNIKIDVADLAKFRSNITARIRMGVRKGALSAGQRTLQLIQGKLIQECQPHPPVDRGLYRAGWQVHGDLVTTPLIISNKVPYAPIIEYGARASNIKIGRAMLTALAEWAQRKGLTGGRKAAKKASLPAKEKGSLGDKAKPAKAAKKGHKSPSILDKKTARKIAKLIKDIKAFMKRMRIGGGMLIARIRHEAGYVESESITKTTATDDEAMAIAWAIAMHMQKVGIFNGGKGLRVLEKAKKVLVKEYLQQEMQREVAKAVRGG
jgi:hypothetical protein